MISLCDYWWNLLTISKSKIKSETFFFSQSSMHVNFSLCLIVRNNLPKPEIWSFYSYFVVFMSKCCGKFDSGNLYDLRIWKKKNIACGDGVFIKPLFNRWHEKLHSSQKHACALYTCVCDLSFMNSYLAPAADAVYCLSLYGKSKGSNLLHGVSQNKTAFPSCKIVFWAPTAATQTNLAIEEMVISIIMEETSNTHSWCWWSCYTMSKPK